MIMRMLWAGLTPNAAAESGQLIHLSTTGRVRLWDMLSDVGQDGILPPIVNRHCAL
jgi:hypothetical protein